MVITVELAKIPVFWCIIYRLVYRYRELEVPDASIIPVVLSSWTRVIVNRIQKVDYKLTKNLLVIKVANCYCPQDVSAAV
jgi:hypothetical protein